MLVVIKWLLIIGLIVMGFVPKAEERFTAQLAINKSGRDIIRVVSHVDYVSYCRLYNSHNTYFIDWYLKPHHSSRWYYVPNGEWYWSCS